MLHAVIMAGGSGTRFWPMSRKNLPKQFLNFHADESLLQQAVARIAGLAGDENVYVVTNRLHVGKTKEQLTQLGDQQIIGEPTGRDTAPCIGLAAAILDKTDPDATMMVLAADHIIEPVERFHQAVLTAEGFLKVHPEALLTMGIPPSRPATGYGYLRKGDEQKDKLELPVYKVRSFHEKPNLETAVKFQESGEYFWNSGMFCWKAKTILAELKARQPELYDGVMEIAKAWGSANQQEVLERVFPTLTKISIDYAVMEKSSNVYMVEAPFNWDDVGSWLALERVFPKTPDGNVIIGEHLGMKTDQCVIAGHKKHLIATLGVKDLIIVHTDEITLVAHRDDEQSVKLLLQQLENLGLERLL